MNAYRRAVRDITDARRARLDAGLEVWRNALADNADLRAAFAEYQTQAVNKAKGGPDSLDAARNKLKTEFERAGLKREQIEPPPQCKQCGDTGIVNGKYCGCVIRRAINADRENLTLPLIDFDDAQKTAPKSMTAVYDAAHDYVRTYPDGKPFFMIAGSSGTGKTVLAAAIACAFLKSGRSAVTVSAFEFVRRAKDYHTQFAIDDYRDLFSPMLDADILCIDDLGTETMLKNITLEYLYTVVNERWLRKKYTVVTTNLTPDALIKRYGEAIFSRLCDKSLANSFMIKASNKRL